MHLKRYPNPSEDKFLLCFNNPCSCIFQWNMGIPEGRWKKIEINALEAYLVSSEETMSEISISKQALNIEKNYHCERYGNFT